MTKKSIEVKKFIPIVFVFIMMILVAMYDNVRGPFVPAIKSDFAVNNKEISWTLLACSLGYMVFTYLGGFLSENIGHKKVFILGFLLIVLSPIGLFLSKNFAIYMLNLFILNAGQALIAIGVNTMIPLIAVGFQAVLMNLTHFFYGLGATITQRLTGVMLYNGMTWRQVYLIIAIISAVIFVGFIFIKMPSATTTTKAEKIDYKSILTNKLVYFYMGTLGFYIAAEQNTGAWFVNFMYDNYGFNEKKCSFYAALFFGMLTIGRLLGGFVVEKIGYFKSVLISVAIALILYLSGLVLGESGIIIISISGLFFAIVFPTMVVTLSHVFKKNVSYITGLVVTVGSFIGMVMNLLIGFLNDVIGVYKTYYVMPTCLLLCLICVFLIYINTRSLADRG
ncbi:MULTISPECIES: MFS transporter [Clostridium]|uniref:Major Facilitator Superfamily protein n=1 Tax=Clostridium novyi (strain NT) TaxID=386415 RepID=A0Q3Q4_CLONN|nr:MFS transporter [Clostridium novyi]ABK61478.1 Major Facilitator Superfamily protein [Clostridium novyi NT]